MFLSAHWTWMIDHRAWQFVGKERRKCCWYTTKKVLTMHMLVVIFNIKMQWIGSQFWHGMCYADTNLRNSQQLFRSLFEHLFNALIWFFGLKAIRSTLMCQFDRHQLVNLINTLPWIGRGMCFAAANLHSRQPFFRSLFEKNLFNTCWYLQSTVRCLLVFNNE